jgi:hypothetical protein
MFVKLPSSTQVIKYKHSDCVERRLRIFSPSTPSNRSSLKGQINITRVRRKLSNFKNVEKEKIILKNIEKCYLKIVITCFVSQKNVFSLLG